MSLIWQDTVSYCAKLREDFEQEVQFMRLSLYEWDWGGPFALAPLD
jgi:hypothetical protein